MIHFRRTSSAQMIVFLAFFLATTKAFAEEVTISTYYPSPYGSYKSLSIQDGGSVYGKRGSLQIARGTVSDLGSHIVFIQEGPSMNPVFMGLGYAQNSTTFGFGALSGSPTALFSPTSFAINATGGGMGIGTSVPLSNLHIQESVDSAIETQLLLSNRNIGSGGAGIGFQTASAAESLLYVPKAGIVLERQASFGRGALKFFNSDTASAAGFAAADERMRITRTGDVGIGTTVPAGKLDVITGAANSNDYFRVNSGGTTGLELRSGATGGTPYIDFSNDVATDYHARLIMAPRGVLQIQGNGMVPPTLTTAQRDAIGAANRVNGMIIYNSDNRRLEYWDGTLWRGISGGHMATMSARGATQNLSPASTTVNFSIQDFPAIGITATPGSPGRFTINRAGTYMITGSAVIHRSNQPNAQGHGLVIGIMIRRGGVNTNFQQGQTVIGTYATTTAVTVTGVFGLLVGDVITMDLATTYAAAHEMRTRNEFDLAPRMSIVQQD